MYPSLHLKGCRQHNLKNLSLNLPKHSIVAIVGVSGSGKSSLAFDTLFAEGQRRYLEYLSPQARSWMKQMPRPDVDLIEGLSPTLAIGQGQQSLYSKGTVATYTDIYDFLALLYTNIGEQHSPLTGKRLVRYSRQEIIDLLLKEYPIGQRIQLLAPVKFQKEGAETTLQRLQQSGFIRMKINQLDWSVEDPLPSIDTIEQIDVIIDRLEIKEGIRERLGLSIETAMDLSQGILKVQEGKDGAVRYFTEVFVCPETMYTFAPLTTANFNFNSPHGACPVCHGQGGQAKVQESLIFWDPQQPIIEQAERLFDQFPRKQSHFIQQIWNAFLDRINIQEEDRIDQISPSILHQILHGSPQELIVETSVEETTKKIKTNWKGIIPILNQGLQDKKIRNDLSELPFVVWETCPNCHGLRLKPESLACLIDGKNIQQLCNLTVSDLIKEINQWTFEGKQALIAEEILPHIQTRLQLLEKVGLGYLELNREGHTLSDGEIQRIQLASQIGAKLSGILYILDEPSLGLHRQDIQQLQEVLQELKELGNSVILVEHEPSLIKQAEYIVELGPVAGSQGGFITFQGSYQDLLNDPHSLTGQWLSGRLHLPPPPKRKIKKEKIKVRHATLHNIHDLSLDIPLNCLVGFCGVSGSGKSTLVRDIIGEEIQKILHQSVTSSVIEQFGSIQRVVFSDKQNSSVSSRSIPATFVDVMTPIRNLFAETRLAKARGYKASRFSLNKKGGRCEACEGLGQIRVSMQFMPDIFIPCDVCQGLRYNYETLQITWENLNIAQVLALPVEEAYALFQYIPNISNKLLLMKDLGLEYLTLGQSFNTLSSGEIQRLRLVADLATTSLEKTLYILDEPSAGLHFQDISKLIQILHRLIEQGHSVFMIEHHLSLLQQADWLIELGPGGGPNGGQVIFEGTPKDILSAQTPTGKVLRNIL